MADPLTVFSSFKLTPLNGSVGLTLVPTVRFNCDLTSAIRSNYEEGRYNMRIVVNSKVVYISPDGSGYYWSGSTGGSRHAYPSEGNDVRTPYHSVAIWYTLTAGQGSLTYATTYRASVELKYYTNSDWTEVAYVNFTTWVPVPYSQTSPDPGDTQEDVAADVGALAWEDGYAGTPSEATSWDVYLSKVGHTLVKVANKMTGPTTVVISTLDYSADYQWRVDAFNVYGSAIGNVWTFSVEAQPAPMPEKAVSPTPTNGESDIKFTQTTLAWHDGGTGEHAATSFAVYIGLHNDESMVCVASGSAIIVPIDTLLIPALYYWRVDSSNNNGTTTGDTWTFTVDDDPIVNIQDDGNWNAGGTYTVDIYTPDTNVIIYLSDNNDSDSTGEILGSEINVMAPVSSKWTQYSIKVPRDCEIGTLRIKWNYNDE